MKSIFRGEDNIIQPIWQMFLLGLVLVASQLIIGMILIVVVGIYIAIVGDAKEAEMMASSFVEATHFMAITTGMSNIIVSLLCILMYKILNKQPIEKMGLTSLKKDKRYFLEGLAFGGVSIFAILGILILFGDYRFEGFYVTTELLWGLVLFIAVGFGEEIMVRGAFQHIIGRKYKIVWAILIPSVIFSMLHFGNPNVGNLAVLNLFLVGVLLAVITYKTRNLWTAIGFHITWNFVQGNILGIEVSGRSFGKGLIHMTRTTDNIMNGGKFGLEAGYVCTIVLVLLMGYYLAVYKQSETR